MLFNYVLLGLFTILFIIVIITFLCKSIINDFIVFLNWIIAFLLFDPTKREELKEIKKHEAFTNRLIEKYSLTKLAAYIIPTGILAIIFGKDIDNIAVLNGIQVGGVILILLGVTFYSLNLAYEMKYKDRRPNYYFWLLATISLFIEIGLIIEIRSSNGIDPPKFMSKSFFSSIIGANTLISIFLIVIFIGNVIEIILKKINDVFKETTERLGIILGFF